MDKLYHFGSALSLIALTTSYLNDGIIVLYNSCMFKEYIPRSGVPQGSNLVSLLFVIFINDRLTSVPRSTLEYADDINQLSQTVMIVQTCNAV